MCSWNWWYNSANYYLTTLSSVTHTFTYWNLTFSTLSMIQLRLLVCFFYDDRSSFDCFWIFERYKKCCSCWRAVVRNSIWEVTLLCSWKILIFAFMLWILVVDLMNMHGSEDTIFLGCENYIRIHDEVVSHTITEVEQFVYQRCIRLSHLTWPSPCWSLWNQEVCMGVWNMKNLIISKKLWLFVTHFQLKVSRNCQCKWSYFHFY